MVLKLKTIIAICVALILVACNNNKRDVVEKSLIVNDTTYVNTTDSIEIPLNINLWNFAVKKSIVCFFSPTSDKHCYIYGFADGRELYAIGEKGHGAGEFLSCNWCSTKSDNTVSLYDIMRGKLFVFDITEDGIKDTTTYSLPKNEDGLTEPMTSIVQYDGDRFLAKRDGESTDLMLLDLNGGKILSSYHCGLRDGKGLSYTPYDYVFDVTNNTILLAYCYFDRIEEVKLKDGKFVTLVIYGKRDFEEIPMNYDELQYENLSVSHSGNIFYILKSYNGLDYGHEVLCIDVESNKNHIVRLDKDVKYIDVDVKGRIVGYNEKENGSIIYVFGKS